MTHNQDRKDIKIALAWCLAWGNDKVPQHNQELLQQMYASLKNDQPVPEAVRDLIQPIEYLLDDDNIFPQSIDQLQELIHNNPLLWNNKIGLVYGGATKIKQYVFESEKLPYLRGASALLDRINLKDIPRFFKEDEGKPPSVTVDSWLRKHFSKLQDALIPELLIYYKGGNILAFCPVAWVDDLANAIEKRYTDETLTANSCGVGATFKPLELRLGLLPDTIDDNLFWLEKYEEHRNNDLVKAYFGEFKEDSFEKRKSFNELVNHLAIKFNQRRSGNDSTNRPSRCYPPMLETHPYLVRDISDRRLAISQISEFPDQTNLSEVLVRKRLVGDIAKKEASSDNLPQWYKKLNLEWHPRGITIQSWVEKFKDFLQREDHQALHSKYYGINNPDNVKEALSLREIGNYHQRFVGYIYADGNNMGGYIQGIKTPQEYKQFSEDIFDATEKAVYIALANHLHPHQLQGLVDPDNANRNGDYIHPFEIVTIGGDDVFLIVPANKALAIAQTIGEEFEKILMNKGYTTNQTYTPNKVHRYHSNENSSSLGTNQCQLSMSTGVLITAENTPIYYAQNLVSQLLKSAKETAKRLKKLGYYGGTIDFLVLKNVTMISSNIKEFRDEGLSKKSGNNNLRFYASPYTLHEIKGLLETLQAFGDFPKSQLYQIRSLLEQGKRTAILNYRYFRTRLKEGQTMLQENFEEAWCDAKTNDGNIAPWMYNDGQNTPDKKAFYETIWRDIVDLLPFTSNENQDKINSRVGNRDNSHKEI